MVEAKISVNPPMYATVEDTISIALIRGNIRAIRNTPAVTIVAECKRAETGVGPSIASGNQVCKPNCADFPIAPINNRKHKKLIVEKLKPKKLILWFSKNLIQLFIFWELVGATSYLLIGFWFNKQSAIKAAKKAFLMTRIGDFG